MTEMIISTGILMVLISVSAPYFNSYTSSSSSANAANILYADLLAQRERCISLCRDTGITIDPNAPEDNGTYIVWEVDPNTGSPRPLKTVCLSQYFGKKITFYGVGECGMTYNKVSYYIIFHPRRRASDGSGWGICEPKFGGCYGGKLNLICENDVSSVTVTPKGEIK